MKSNDFVKWLYPAAVNSSDIDPVFIVAQAALESGWAKRVVGKYNLFGVTKGSWHGPTILVRTTEIFETPDVKFAPPERVINITPLQSGNYRYSVDRLFRDYASLEECLEDHFRILQKPHFSHAWPLRKDGRKFVWALQSGRLKYATAKDYPGVIISVMKTVERIMKEEGI